jgi:hypothetical protein
VRAATSTAMNRLIKVSYFWNEGQLTIMDVVGNMSVLWCACAGKQGF